MNSKPLLDAIRHFDTCLLANAIERLNVRPRNEGFVSGEVTCRFPHLPPVTGHAVTARVRTYMPPVTGRCYYDHIEWWRYVTTIPPPRFIVVQDIDSRPAFGAIFGEIHANICRALDGVALLSNGAVRDLDPVEALGYQMFSGRVSVSHSYAHIVDFGQPVEIGGIRILPGDVLHGDRHGVIQIPHELLPSLPAMVEKVQSEEAEILQMTNQRPFSVEALAKKIEKFAESHICK